MLPNKRKSLICFFCSAVVGRRPRKDGKEGPLERPEKAWGGSGRPRKAGKGCPSLGKPRRPVEIYYIVLSIFSKKYTWHFLVCFLVKNTTRKGR